MLRWVDTIVFRCIGAICPAFLTSYSRDIARSCSFTVAFGINTRAQTEIGCRNLA